MSEFQYFLDCCVELDAVNLSVELDAVNLSVELDAVNLTATNLARSRLERSMRSCQPKKAGLGGWNWETRSGEADALCSGDQILPSDNQKGFPS